MKLSVIIVNYNVEHFLEQCLNSVFQSLKGVDGEVLVIDNNSIDGSVDMVRQKFPQVRLFANSTNAGFSKANNQGIRESTGEYVLLLNPDTVVEENTFTRVVQFMDKHAEAGGLGVKMLDGKGKFLPESKRGLPTPAVAFYKMVGLSKIFPKSKTFGKYHLGFLSAEETHEIEILSGAFMLMRKTVLDKIGYLDESFFMYGEDIDLSYRIVKAGYKNYYFPETRIIHYKGESTKKSSVNYVFVFYNAMIIFARKHFSNKRARMLSFFIKIAIYLRASAAIASRVGTRAIVPVIDFVAGLAGLFTLGYIYRNETDILLPDEIINVAFPAYTAVWVTSIFLAGGYDKPVKLRRVLRGWLFGTLLILSIYALLDKDYQFSRILTFIGSISTLFIILLLRLIYHLLSFKGYGLYSNNNKRFLIIGDEAETKRVDALLNQTDQKVDFVGYAGHDNMEKPDGYLGKWNQVDQIIHIHKIDELIFCAKNVSAENIISKMATLEKSKIDFKIAQPETLFLIGSSSIDTSGDLYMLDINGINNATNRRNKRLLDLVVSVILTATFPINIWFVKHKGRYLSNLIRVLFGSKSFVGYSELAKAINLPKIKPGILTTLSAARKQVGNEEIATKLNLIYAKDYKITTDVNILLSNFRYLGD